MSLEGTDLLAPIVLNIRQECTWRDDIAPGSGADGLPEAGAPYQRHRSVWVCGQADIQYRPRPLSPTTAALAAVSASAFVAVVQYTR